MNSAHFSRPARYLRSPGVRLHDWQTLPPQQAATELTGKIAGLSEAVRQSAVASVAPEAALESLFAAAKPGPLRGVPCFVKDLFDVDGFPTKGGSPFLPQVRDHPPRDGAMAKALKAAGAVIVGKAQLHEFAYGLTGENPHFGDCTHPRFPDRTSGGSSSGSAVLAAHDVVPLTIGTDTGGSLRVPAAFCGLYSVRLTPHDQFIADAFPLAPSFDTAGWFTRDAATMGTTLKALLGNRTTSPKKPTPLRGIYLSAPAAALVETDLAQTLRETADKLASPADSLTTQMLHTAFADSSEAFSILQSTEAAEVHQAWLDARKSEYSPAVWARIDRGRHWTPAQRQHAEIQRDLVQTTFSQFFTTHDFLVMPATPFLALAKTELTDANRGRLLSLTTPVSLAGLPALTVPVILPNGLSSGLQIIFRTPDSAAFRAVLAQLS